jgi:hypothetical protein
MQRPACLCEAKYQTAWAVFVVWIVFNDLTMLNSFVEFLDADMAKDTLINCMLGKFKLVLRNLLANLFDPRQRCYSCTLLRRHVSTLGSAIKKAEYGAFLAPVIPDSAGSIRLRWLAQRPVPPAAHAHHVEAFALEDDLLYGLPAVVALALQVVTNFHPADFAVRGADYQQHGE